MFRLLPLFAVLVHVSSFPVRETDPEPISPRHFHRLHRMIRAQPNEQRFWQIDWKLSITEARRQAAAEGKPILVWGGAGGPPIGAC